MTYAQDKAFRCEQCGRVASEVHHVVPIQTDDGWTKRLDYDNLDLKPLKAILRHFNFIGI